MAVQLPADIATTQLRDLMAHTWCPGYGGGMIDILALRLPPFIARGSGVGASIKILFVETKRDRWGDLGAEPSQNVLAIRDGTGA